MSKKALSSDMAVEALISTGMKKNTAKVLVHLAANKRTTSDEVEEQFGLGQPGVSASIHDLDNMGWIHTESVKGPGKGRPKHTYTLSKPFMEIVSEIETAQRAKIMEMESNISNLRTMYDTEDD
jgi:predicted transcriptional regulator